MDQPEWNELERLRQECRTERIRLLKELVNVSHAVKDVNELRILMVHKIDELKQDR